MGYEAREPVALCDGCRKALYDGDEAWICEINDGREFVVRTTQHLALWQTHYCRITPCLEKAVVNELRKLHGVYHQDKPAQQMDHPYLLPDSESNKSSQL